MKNIAKEFEFGFPWRMSENSMSVVVPVLRPDHGERSYVLADEIEDEIDYEDSGDIEGVLVENHHPEPAFLRGGNVLKGKGTQSRATRYGIVVMPEKKAEAKVKCVHSSHPISAGKEFQREGYYPDRRLKTSLLEGNQSQVWAMVSRASSQLSTSYQASGSEQEVDRGRLASENLAKVKEARESISQFKESVEEIVQEMPTREDQVGIVVLDDKGVSGVEVFDHPASWNALKEAVVEEYQDKITEKDETGLFELKEERIDSLLAEFFGKVMDYEKETVHESDGAKTMLIEGDDVVGEVTVIEGETIHILFVREEDGNGVGDGNERVINTSLGGGEDTGERRPPRFGRLHAARGDSERKGFEDVLRQTKDEPKTWSEMDIDISTRTKSKRLEEAKEQGYITEVERESNGRKSYSITPKGIQALKDKDIN